MSYNAVSHKFNANESTIHHKRAVFKQKHTQNKVIWSSVDKNVATRISQKPNPIFPLEK